MVKQEAVIRYIAEGFQRDAEKILKAFSEKHTYQFSIFSRLWKEANFSFVYLGRETEDELREFTSECFLITLSYLTPVSSMRLKIGALYLLYALYVKQPLEHRFRIRVSLIQWNELTALFDAAFEEDKLGVCYIFNKLVNMNAFHAVALPRLMGPRVTISSEVTATTESRVENLKGVLDEFVANKHLQRVGNMHEKYEDQKKKLFGANNADFSLLMPNKSEALLTKARALIQSGGQLGHTSMSSLEYDDIGDRRVGLKTKQYERESTSWQTDRCNELQEGYSMTPQNGAVTSGDETFVLPQKKKFKKKRRRERKVGRPKKVISEDEGKTEEDEDDEEPYTAAVYSTGNGLKRKMQRIRKTYYHYNGDSDEEPFFDAGWL